MFAEDKRRNYPSAGLSPDQVSSMTYTMDELENGKGNVNPSVNSSPSLVNNNQVKAGGSVNQGGGVNNLVGSKTHKTRSGYPGGVNPTDGPDYLASLYTSPQQEEELRKSSVNKQRVMALADALRHIGNIYHTTRYSPSQQFSSPVLEERNRYLQEKAVRDANNYKFQTYQQAKAAQEAKIRQAERDFEYKVGKDARDYELNKQKADSQLKTDEARRNQIEAGIKKTNLETEYIPKNFEEKQRMNDNTIRHQKVQEQQGAARIALQRASQAETRRHHRYIESRSSRGVLGTSKDRDLVFAPSGATYSFPKGTFTGAKGKANLETMYKQMAAKGLVPEEGSLWDGAFIERLNDEDKLSYIMDAASTASGHDDFVYAAKRLGYKYEGGMAPEYSDKIFKESRRRSNSMKSNVKAGATSSGNNSSKPSTGLF